ncbi:efflux RND transporter periplasmic adaptor subunit [Uliginosibacterium flavum]|uniref:Efflux RND transporter periplasmic adaptor subunit n=1 Tax=Uliginosibacterium flavum TaxID=1396831 RepID=A0ABV2TK15_9RHOO
MKAVRPLLRQSILSTSLVAALLALPLISSAADKAASPPAKAALSVNTVMPTRADWPVRLSANGSITAWQEAIVGAEIAGLRLIEVLVNTGDQVRKGQVLARLQSATTEAELAQTLASLAEAEANLAEAHANAERARQLDGTGAFSAQLVSQYLTGETTARARVDGLKARIKADQLRLAQTQVLAPDDGTISARTATLGAVVQPGQELYRLIRRNRLEWRAELPATDLLQIKPGMAVSITTASKGKVSGKVRMVAPTLDAQTRTGLVYVDLIGNGDAKPGMFARGEIEIARGGVLTVPQSAVILRDGFSYVLRVGADQRLTQTKVIIGQRSGDRIAITGGLAADAAIVSNGVGFLADGDLVRVVAPTAASAPTSQAR